MNRLELKESSLVWWVHFLYLKNEKKDFVIWTQGERYCLNCIQNWFRFSYTSFSIWASVRWNYKSDLVFLKGHGPKGECGKDDYINQVLKPVVSSAIKELKARGFKLLYQKNGNGIHGLKDMNKLRHLKKDLGIHAMHEWPSTSANFNSIENVWWILKQRIHTKGQNRTLAQCKAACLENERSWHRRRCKNASKWCLSEWLNALIEMVISRLSDAIESQENETAFLSILTI